MMTFEYQTDHPDTTPGPPGVDTLEISLRAGPGAGSHLVLEIAPGFDQVVGRDASADVTVADPAISRRHARITREPSGVWLEDLGSTNGTYINGDRLLHRHRLRDADEVKIGSAVAVFHDVMQIPDSTQRLEVIRDLAAGPESTERHHPVEKAAGPACPSCSAVLASDMWFCHQCGYQPRPIAIRQASTAQSGAESTRQKLIGPHGHVRSWQFRRVMRSRNGGRRPLYNESLAVPALLLRLLLIVALIVAVVTALVILGMGVHHFVQLRQQPVPTHSHSFVPVKFHSRVR